MFGKRKPEAIEEDIFNLSRRLGEIDQLPLPPEFKPLMQGELIDELMRQGKILGKAREDDEAAD